MAAMKLFAKRCQGFLHATKQLVAKRRFSEVAGWRSDLLEVVRQVPSDFTPAGRAAPVLESLRKLQLLEVQHAELLQQRDQESKATATAEEMRELMLLYDSELEAAESRLNGFSEMLEQELLIFQREELRGDRLEELDAAANGRDAVLELMPGVGGQEAALFTGELMNMYERFAEQRGWQFEVESLIEVQPEGAVNFASVRIAASNHDEENAPFGWLRHESGVHRVQRVPVTERKGRMQTSSVAVVLLPVAEEADVTLSPAEVRIEISKKSSGPGGQSVNAAHQAVRATHLPTGISVHCTSSQSQFENKTRALDMLRTKLLDQQLCARADFERSERKGQRGTKDRSEKIRTYNFQRDEVVDHRLPKDQGGSGHSASDVLFAGGLEEILLAHQAQTRSLKIDLKPPAPVQ